MDEQPKVWSRRKGSPTPPADAVYVGRPSPWGNPYHVLQVDFVLGRHEAIEAYRRYAIKRAVEEPGWLEPLRGKHLICWCAPKPCHADVLLELANGRQSYAATLF